MSLAIRTTTPPLPSGDSMSSTILPAPGSAQLDPREAMIEGLTKQNESLLETFEKATQVFQQNQVQQKQTITTLAKTNEELQAALIASEGRIKEIELVHQAEMKALEDRVKKLSEDNIALQQFKDKAKPRLAAISTHYSEFKKRCVSGMAIAIALGRGGIQAWASLNGKSSGQVQEYLTVISHEEEMQRELKETAEQFKNGEFQ